MKLRTKIVLALLSLSIGGVLVVGLLSSWQIKNFLDRRMESQLLSRVDLLSSLFTKGIFRPDDLARRDHDLREIARSLEIRVTLVHKDGAVVFDSDVSRDSVARLENHKNRLEILKARTGLVGTDRRRSNSLGVDFLYAARMITGDSLGSLDSGYVRVALPAYELQHLETQVQTIVIIVGFLAVVIIALVSLQLSKRFSRPILNIVDTARVITRGDVDKRVTYTANDEVGELSTAINNMAEKLASDIAQLKKLERVRSEFLANVSHELRTPIFSIQGFLETLLDGAVDDPHVNRDFLEKAHRQAERLSALLNDLIEISRIESGDMKMSYRYFLVPEFLLPIIEEMRPAAVRKNISLSLALDCPSTTKVYGDKERLKQVMVNLIDNAVKYTDPGGTVSCRARLLNGQCEIAVADTGCGIAAEHLPRIFERFYRVDRDRSREIGGTGLGLAIAKHIVEAHESELNVTSDVGKGSTFSFNLKS